MNSLYTLSDISFTHKRGGKLCGVKKELISNCHQPKRLCEVAEKNNFPHFFSLLCKRVQLERKKSRERGKKKERKISCSLGGFFSFSVWSGALKVFIEEKGKKRGVCGSRRAIRAIKVKWAWKKGIKSSNNVKRQNNTQCIKVLSVQHSCRSLFNSNQPFSLATLAFYRVVSVQAATKTTTTTHHIGPDLVRLLKSSSSLRNKIWTFLSPYRIHQHRAKENSISHLTSHQSQSSQPAAHPKSAS